MRILYTWEIGDGQGHVRNLVGISRHERLRQHDQLFATPQQRSSDRYLAAEGIMPMEAPAATCIDIREYMPAGAAWHAKSFADILTVMGYAKRDHLAYKVAKWAELIMSVKPDLIVAESAPTVVLAARGACPVLAVGTPYGCPPTHMARFPNLLETDAEPALELVAHVQLAATIEAVTGAQGSLPSMLQPDETFPFCYPEMDLYRADRPSPSIGPLHGVRPIAMQHDGTFCYLSNKHPNIKAILGALRMLDETVRIYVSGKRYESFAGGNLTILDSFDLADELAKCARVVHHGSIGIAQAAMGAGRAQFVFPYHSENMQNCMRLVDLGVVDGAGYAEPSTYLEALRRPFHGSLINAVAVANRLPPMDAGTIVADAINRYA